MAALLGRVGLFLLRGLGPWGDDVEGVLVRGGWVTPGRGDRSTRRHMWQPRAFIHEERRIKPDPLLKGEYHNRRPRLTDFK